MKKLFVFAMVTAVLTIFNGCQKEELRVSQLANEVQPPEVVKPDVYVENGYLVFKDLNSVNSLMKMLNSMNFNDVIQWEKSIGFESAKTYFEPFFKEGEMLNSIEEISSFREKYKEVLKWNENDVDEFSFDYPYMTSLIQVINKEGLVKIGKSLFKYNKENRITIFDGDFSKLDVAMKLNHSTDNILITNEISRLKSSYTSYSNTGLTQFEGQYGSLNSGDNDEWCLYHPKRRMKTGLNLERFTYLDANGITYSGGYNIYLWQRAQKRSLGIWWNYSVRYRYGNVIYKENGVTKFAMSGYSTTPSTQSTEITFYTDIPLQNQSPQPSLSEIPIPQMYFSCFTTNEDFNYYQISVSYSD